MKAIFNLRRHSYLKTIGTFLIAVALIAGVVGCEGEGEGEEVLDHFKCYWVDPIGGPPEEVVSLEDQFGSINATVLDADLFCNPTEKLHNGETTPISYPENHLTIYDLEYGADPVARRVAVTNQFGPQDLTVEFFICF